MKKSLMFLQQYMLSYIYMEQLLSRWLNLSSNMSTFHSKAALFLSIDIVPIWWRVCLMRVWTENESSFKLLSKIAIMRLRNCMCGNARILQKQRYSDLESNCGLLIWYARGLFPREWLLSVSPDWMSAHWSDAISSPGNCSVKFDINHSFCHIHGLNSIIWFWP